MQSPGCLVEAKVLGKQQSQNLLEADLQGKAKTDRLVGRRPELEGSV